MGRKRAWRSIADAFALALMEDLRAETGFDFPLSSPFDLSVLLKRVYSRAVDHAAAHANHMVASIIEADLFGDDRMTIAFAAAMLEASLGLNALKLTLDDAELLVLLMEKVAGATNQEEHVAIFKTAIEPL